MYLSLNWPGDMRSLFATCFLSTIFLLATIPSVLLILPISTIFGAIRAISLVFSPGSQLPRPEKAIEDDSGMEASSEEESDSENLNVKNNSSGRRRSAFFEKYNFSVKNVSENANLVTYTENIAESITCFARDTGKTLVLVTFRDVATLTGHPSTLENTARIQYKKRKLKVVDLASSPNLAETLSEILKNGTEGSMAATWIYILCSKMSVEEMADHREYHNEIKRIAEEFSESSEVFARNLATSKSQLLAIHHDGLVWFNAGI
uniref:Uncharacterized protein n=2 Tax=Caenorhabditis japonica TaxID=281687 RepID=A0A8R1IUS8_CAEJA